MRLHFDAPTLIRLLAHSEQSEVRIALRGQRTPDAHGPDNVAREVPTGLWLAGDDGVYFGSNGYPPLLIGDGPTRVVAYAEETDPHRNPDISYDAKEAAFGGDDGVIFVSRASVLTIIAYSRDRRACVNFTPTSLGAMAPAGAAGQAKGRHRR